MITVTAPSTPPVDLDRLRSPNGFRALTVFGATKAANLMTTFELARRAEGRASAPGSDFRRLSPPQQLSRRQAPRLWGTP